MPRQGEQVPNFPRKVMVYRHCLCSWYSFCELLVWMISYMWPCVRGQTGLGFSQEHQRSGLIRQFSWASQRGAGLSLSSILSVTLPSPSPGLRGPQPQASMAGRSPADPRHSHRESHAAFPGYLWETSELSDLRSTENTVSFPCVILWGNLARDLSPWRHSWVPTRPLELARSQFSLNPSVGPRARH